MIKFIGDKHTKLLLHGDSFDDKSLDKRKITNNGVSVSTAQSKFGGSSLYFDGSSYLTIPGYDFGAEDFTLDWWEYPTNANAGTRFTNVYCTSYSTQAGGLLTHLYASGLKAYLSNKTGGASTSDWNVLADKTLGANVLNTWTHRAVVRSGSNLLFFKNGTLEYTYDVGSNVVGYSSSRPWGIGNWASDLMTTGYPYIGYLDEFRVSDVARWTTNFTPSAEPYEDSSVSITPGGIIPMQAALRRMIKPVGAFDFTYTGTFTDTIIDSNRVITLTSSGTLTVTDSKTCQLYLLAGGGGGAYASYKAQNASGGGGGNLLVSDFEIGEGDYDITIGKGGAAAIESKVSYAGSGGDTVGFGYTCTGGTGGGTSYDSNYPGAGGSPNGGNGNRGGYLDDAAGGTPNGGSITWGEGLKVNAGGDGYITITIPI